MGKSKIEWTDRVWNPVTGCSKISPGCDNCYAESMSRRFADSWGLPVENPFKVTLHPDRLEQPLHWKNRCKIFVCSMSDLFHDDVPDDFIFAVFMTMGRTRGIGHTFIVLTKRPERMQKLVTKWINDGVTFHEGCTGRFPSFIWIGVTAENQEQADNRIPILLQIPAAVRFVSVEPMLGPVDINRWMKETCTNCGGIGRVPNHPHIPSRTCQRCKGTGKIFYPRLDWVICGGESGPGARPMHPEWARSLRDQCQTAGVPFFFKQWGEWHPISQMTDGADSLYFPPPKNDPDAIRDCMYKTTALQLNGEMMPVYIPESWGHGAMQTFKVGKKKAGSLLDGQEWKQFPKEGVS